jgi:hypothetical protein
MKNLLDNFKKEASQLKKVLLVYLICLLISFIYVPQCIYYEGKKISWPYTFIWSIQAPAAHVDLAKIFMTISILTIVLGIVILVLPKNGK